MALNMLGIEDAGAGPKAVALQSRHFQRRLGILETTRWLYTGSTANATPLALTPDAENYTLTPNTVYGFRGFVLGRKTDGTDCVFSIQGGIKQVADASTTALVGTPTVTAYEDNAGTDCALTADTTNGRLIITVTGLTASTISWRAAVEFAYL
jgi:hypothetical protein